MRAPARSAPGLLPGLAGLICLLASLPSARSPWTFWLVLPGLAALFMSFLAGGRRRLRAYALGLAFFAVQSWSLRPALPWGWPCIPLLGALYFVLAAVAFLSLGRLPAVLRPAAAGLVWAGTEWLRAHAPVIRYPHGQAVHALFTVPQLLLPARFAGETFAGFLLAAAAAGLLAVLRPVSFGFASRARAVAAGLLPILLTWSFTAWAAPAPGRAGRALRVALVQPAEAVYPDQPGYLARRGRKEYERLVTFAAARRDTLARADLVVYPESACPFPLWEEGLKPRLLRRLASDLAAGRPLLIGADLAAGPKEDPRRTNVALLFDGRGRLLGVWRKKILVPLGEYLPGLDLMPRAWRRRLLDALAGFFGAFTPELSPGSGSSPLHGPGLPPLGVLVCFENAFPEAFAELAAHGAGLFCILSNEAWYRRGAELDQMLAMSVLRAIETGRPVLRATNDGLTVLVEADGRVAAALPRGRPGLLEVSVRPRRGLTPAVSLGRWFGRLSCLVLALCLVAALWGRPKPPSRGADRPALTTLRP